MSRYSLKRGGQRPQAWLGTVLTLASTAASLYSKYKDRQAQVQMNNDNVAAQNAELQRQNQLAMANMQANVLNNYYTNEELRRRNLNQDLIYACGGRKSLRAATGAKVQITDGGVAIPIGNGNFLLRGSSHNQVNESGHTGIGMKVGKRTIEAEGGEVIRPTRKSLLIYSRRLPLGNGLTPAQSVLAGYNPQAVFAAQQQENGNNSTPVKGNRYKAGYGDWINFGSDIATALGTALINNNAYKKLNVNLQKPNYYEETPVILDTKYHNAGQLANLERMRLAGNTTIGRNSANSQLAQARMRLNNLDYGLKQNELIDYAANYNANMRNQQAQLEQGVRQRNIAAKNLWSAQVADTINRERELGNNRTLMRGQNWSNMLAGFNRAGTNLYTAINQRKSDTNALRAYMAASNPGSDETFLLNGGTFGPEVDAEYYNRLRNVAKTEDQIALMNKIRGRMTSWQRRYYLGEDKETSKIG